MLATELTKKITLLFWTENETPGVKKSFVGRWLVGSETEGLAADDGSNSWVSGIMWSVAQTRKEAIVVYMRDDNDNSAPIMECFNSFEDFMKADVPSNVIAEVAAALGKHYEIELNI